MTLLGTPTMTVEEYARHYDMALLAPDVTETAIREAAQQAVDTKVYGFVFNPCWTKIVVDILDGSDVVAGACISFPYGTMTSTMKSREIAEALEQGAGGIDMVTNIGAVKENGFDLVRAEVADLARQCRAAGADSKLIFEVGFLTDDAIATLTKICCDEGITYVKTATGSQAFPTESQVRIMKQNMTGDTKLKVSGVPRTFTLAASLWMLDMGVDLIGTRSAPGLVAEYRTWLASRS
ncbi:deoxyribose-phosphate aldolase [Propionicicella superfundia]|uniref:deoxyribose-phosphate aldolase n=1 Tax=Propionicicella superfundia TaxID=348582 RepID=UPI00041E34F4|nr:deoxyribose-phosphate aldolase [Propionicicella superfundia]